MNIQIFQESIASKSRKAQEVEELTRQGICDIKPCCCDACYPCKYERIAEARKIIEASKV